MLNGLPVRGKKNLSIIQTSQIKVRASSCAKQLPELWLGAAALIQLTDRWQLEAMPPLPTQTGLHFWFYRCALMRPTEVKSKHSNLCRLSFVTSSALNSLEDDSGDKSDLDFSLNHSPPQLTWNWHGGNVDVMYVYICSFTTLHSFWTIWVFFFSSAHSSCEPVRRSMTSSLISQQLIIWHKTCW